MSFLTRHGVFSVWVRLCVCVCVVSDPLPPTPELWSRELELRPRALGGKKTKVREPRKLRVAFVVNFCRLQVSPFELQLV